MWHAVAVILAADDQVLVEGLVKVGDLSSLSLMLEKDHSVNLYGEELDQVHTVPLLAGVHVNRLVASWLSSCLTNHSSTYFMHSSTDLKELNSDVGVCVWGISVRPHCLSCTFRILGVRRLASRVA